MTQTVGEKDKTQNNILLWARQWSYGPIKVIQVYKIPLQLYHIDEGSVIFHSIQLHSYVFVLHLLHKALRKFGSRPPSG